MFDIVVVGAGVVGALIARTLSAYRLDVCIVEAKQDVAMAASSANSAIVHAGFDAKEGTLKAALNVRGAEMMEGVCRELGVKYRNNGSLVIAFNDADVEMLHTLLARGEKNGVKGLRILNREELQKAEPHISKNVVAALYAPTAGIVCPYGLTVAAVGNAMDNGAQLRLGFRVTGIEDLGGFFRVSAENGKSVEARYIINAAGLFSDDVAALAGDTSFTVHARRGEYILLDKECGNLVSATVFRTPSKMGKGILVTPTVDGNLLMGPTSLDISDKDDRSTTAEGLSTVMKEAGENVDGLAFGKAITSFCGLRAVGSTGDFIINSPSPGFVNVAGIESPGLSSAPAIAEYVVELLRGMGCTLEKKKKWNPNRAPMHAFREASAEEKNEIIRNDPAFGRIVCRCETVTEGEILQAIRQNPRPTDLDGVKRRTRAQMGRCQGGFCSPTIVELLARELKIPFEAVTKNGGGSYINVGKTKEVNGNG